MLYTEEEYMEAYRQGFNDAVHEFNEGYQLKDKTMNDATSRIVYRRHLPKIKPEKAKPKIHKKSKYERYKDKSLIIK
jgi:hypothetical protein